MHGQPGAVEAFFTLLVFCVFWTIVALTGRWLSKATGRNGNEGLILCMLFGPLGLILVCVIGVVAAIRSQPQPQEARRTTVTLNRPSDRGVMKYRRP